MRANCWLCRMPIREKAMKPAHKSPQVRRRINTRTVCLLTAAASFTARTQCLRAKRQSVALPQVARRIRPSRCKATCCASERSCRSRSLVVIVAISGAVMRACDYMYKCMATTSWEGIFRAQEEAFPSATLLQQHPVPLTYGCQPCQAASPVPLHRQWRG
jgi:hypothetical protein